MVDLISIEGSSNKVQVIINIECLKVIVNSTQIILDKITYAFHARTGYSLEEVIAFKKRISEQIEVSSYNLDNQPFLKNTISLSFEDIIITNECLNEVCNGLKIKEFENEVGLSKISTEKLLSDINAIALQIS